MKVRKMTDLVAYSFFIAFLWTLGTATVYAIVPVECQTNPDGLDNLLACHCPADTGSEDSGDCKAPQTFGGGYAAFFDGRETAPKSLRYRSSAFKEQRLGTMMLWVRLPMPAPPAYLTGTRILSLFSYGTSYRQCSLTTFVAPSSVPGGNPTVLYYPTVYSIDGQPSKRRGTPFTTPDGGVREPPLSLMNDGEWHHIALVFQQHYAEGYLDGVLLTTFSNSSIAYPRNFDSNEIRLGLEPDHVHLPHYGYYDEVRVYNATLTGDQIRQQMHRQPTPPERDNLLLWLTFDDQEEPFKDSSKYKHRNLLTSLLDLPEIRPSTGIPMASDRLVIKAKHLQNETQSSEFNITFTLHSAAMNESWGRPADSVEVSNCSGSRSGTFTAGPDVSMDANTLPVQVNGSSLCFVPAEGYSGSFTCVVNTFLNRTRVSSIQVEYTVLENQPPLVGNAGGAISCDGIDDYMLARNFDFPFKNFTHSDTNQTIYGGSPFTIEFWTSIEKNFRNSIVFSIGMGRDGSNTRDFQYPGKKVGNFYGALSRTDESDTTVLMSIGAMTNVETKTLLPEEEWAHISLIHEQAGGHRLQIYVNGELRREELHDHLGIGQGLGTQTSAILPSDIAKALHVCTRSWGSNDHFKGSIDEFRIWDYVRSPEQIQSGMHSRLTGKEEGLLGYWNFDEQADVSKLFPNTSNYDPAVARDVSGHGNDLIASGCVPCEQQYMGWHPFTSKEGFSPRACNTIVDLADIPKCGEFVCEPPASFSTAPTYQEDIGVVNSGNACYYPSGTPPTRGSKTKMPARVLSKAKVGGVVYKQLAQVGERSFIQLNASDPDKDPLVFIITRLPQQGVLEFMESNESKPIPDDGRLPREMSLLVYSTNTTNGGEKADSFDYQVSDGMALSNQATVFIDIACRAGFYIDSDSLRCTECPPGFYQSRPDGCTACSANTFQNATGQVNCTPCPPNTYAEAGARVCVSCDDPNAKEDRFSISGPGCRPKIRSESTSDIYIPLTSLLPSTVSTERTRILVLSQPQRGLLYEAKKLPFNTTRRRDRRRWLAKDERDDDDDDDNPLSNDDDGVKNQGDGKIQAGEQVGTTWMRAQLLRASVTQSEKRIQFATRVIQTDLNCTNAPNVEGILGPPDLADVYGMSEERGMTKRALRVCNNYRRLQMVELEFSTAVAPVEVVLYENYRPGTLQAIHVLNPENNEWVQEMWRRPPEVFDVKRGMGRAVYQRNTYNLCSNFRGLSNRIRLTLQRFQDGSSSELDAVALLGFDTSNVLSVVSANTGLLYNPGTADRSQPSGDIFSLEITSCDYIPGQLPMNDAVSLSVDIEKSNEGLSKAGIIVVIFGCSFFVLLTLLSVIYVRHRKLRLDATGLEEQLLRERDVPTSAIVNHDDITIGMAIGEGGAGVVYEGTLRGTKVAIKKLHNLYANNEETYKLIRQEAQLMIQFRHPNIVLFMGCCLVHDHLCILSQFCSKGSLHQVLHTSHIELPWPLRLKIAAGICRGLTYLHNFEPAYIHRDIKTPNILIDESWNAKLSDFGSIRRLKQAAETGNTGGFTEHALMTTEIGTIQWAAPEVLLAAKNAKGHFDYTVAVDIYGLGVVLWEIATRQAPFQEYSFSFQIINAVISGVQLPTPQDLPEAYRKLVTQCLAFDPLERPSAKYCEDVIASLMEYYGYYDSSSDLGSGTSTQQMGNFTETSLSSVNMRSVNRFEDFSAPHSNELAVDISTPRMDNLALHSPQTNASQTYTPLPI